MGLSAKLTTAEYYFAAELDVFRRTTGLTEAEEAEFRNTSFASLLYFIRTLQEQQDRDGNMIYMKRLEPFLVSMSEYVEAIEVAGVIADTSDLISYLWASNQKRNL